MDPLSIRAAGPGDAAALTAIALEAKRHWGYPEAWMALWTEALTITTAFIAAHDVWVAESAGRIHGFCAVVVEPTRGELAHLWVRPAHMGRGVGRRLFEHAVRQLRERAPGVALHIEADPHAEAFYVKMGARRVGEITREWPGLTRVVPELELAAR